jgi:hypothetical protein
MRVVPVLVLVVAACGGELSYHQPDGQLWQHDDGLYITVFCPVRQIISVDVVAPDGGYVDAYDRPIELDPDLHNILVASHCFEYQYQHSAIGEQPARPPKPKHPRTIWIGNADKVRVPIGSISTVEDPVRTAPPILPTPRLPSR